MTEPMVGKIYTRTGDKGETSLFGGKRVSKTSIRVDTYGTVDELNSIVGVVISHLSASEKKLRKELEAIQHDLLEIGSSLANPTPKTLPYLDARVGEFEQLIDKLTLDLPELRNFILPGGGQAGAFLHQARTICRRCERRIIALSQEEDIADEILRYFNRLSDLFFTMARYCNCKEKQPETIWVKK